MCTSGLAGERHVVWIASKGRNVLVNPDERRSLIEKAIVACDSALSRERRMAQETKRTEAIVGRDDDCPSGCG